MSDGQPSAATEDQPFVSLYRRFRPGRFGEVRGQPHVVLALQSAVRDDRVSHAYLFSGPRGTGKTSTARILAKALNCANPVDGEPCGVCTSCTEIERGNSLDVHELDAASNNGVDDMRDLVSHSALGTPGRWKVYIVDEVHMLSTSAANALLKTLEEPPSHVVFVLATTDPQKVAPTIRSRTQHFEFRLLGAETLEDLLRDVGRQADLGLDDEALSLAVRRGKGSARDALSALDQVVATGSADEFRPELSEVVEALCDEDVHRVLVSVAALHESGWGPAQLASELVDDLRQGFLLTLAPELSGASGSEHERLTSQAERLGLPRLVRTMEVIGRAQVDMRNAPDPRVVLEMALARVAHPDLDDSAAALGERLIRVERALAGGTAVPSAPAGPPPAVSASAVVAQAQAAAQGPAAAPGEPAVKPSLGALRKQREAAAGPDAVPAPRDRPVEALTPTPTPTSDPVSPSGVFPDRDALVQAWGDSILRTMPVKAKVLFSAGRFVSVEEGTASFALPNEAHRDRCREVQSLVEGALAAHFGVPVPLVLVVDGGEGPPPAAPRAGAGGTAPRPGRVAAVEVVADDMEDFDPNEPLDATPVDSVAEARLLQAFPGAEEVPG